MYSCVGITGAVCGNRAAAPGVNLQDMTPTANHRAALHQKALSIIGFWTRSLRLKNVSVADVAVFGTGKADITVQHVSL